MVRKSSQIFVKLFDGLKLSADTSATIQRLNKNLSKFDYVKMYIDID